MDALVTAPALLISCLWQFAYAHAGGTADYVIMTLGRHYGSSTTKDFMWESTENAPFSATSYTLQGGGLGSCFVVRSATFPVPFDNVDRSIFCYHSRASNHAAAPIVAGETGLTTYDADVSANYPTGAAANSGGVFVRGATNGWCSQTSGTTPTKVFLYPYMAVSHQGRIVAANHIANGSFAGAAQKQAWIAFSPPNDPLGTASTNMHGAFLLDRGEFQGAAAIASLTADELFIVGHQGGALVVRGDVANPTVVQLPYVTSSNGWACFPAVSPIGVVYTARDGVYRWAGGDTSECLSEQLEGTFFNYFASGESTTSNFAARGRLASWAKYIAVPNNYLYDTDSKAWWRLVAPDNNTSTPYAYYDVDAEFEQLFAFPYKLTATQNVVCDKFALGTLASSYSWRSQPLVQSRDRLFTTQQVELVAANSTASDSRVTVTLEGIDAEGVLQTRTVEFTLTGTSTSGGRPQILRKSIAGGSLTARYLQLRIVATNASTTAPAPKIMSLSVGIADRSRQPEA
jgi:hypothetical protein